MYVFGVINYHFIPCVLLKTSYIYIYKAHIISVFRIPSIIQQLYAIFHTHERSTPR